MRVFVTGATGWVGSAVVDELLSAGYEVHGLSRTVEKAAKLEAQGGQVVIGNIEDTDLLFAEANGADAVIHTAFNNDFTRFVESAEEDIRAIQAIGRALEGKARPFLITSGVTLLTPDRVATEEDQQTPNPAMPRKTEPTTSALRASSVNALLIRLSPTVHGDGDQAFMRRLIGVAKKTGVSGYVGDGLNRWPAVHRRNAATIYRLALTQAAPISAFHAVSEGAIPFKDIATAIGQKLGLPIEPRDPEHFGFLAPLVAGDMPASSSATKSALGWQPKYPRLLQDLQLDSYYTD